MVYRWLDIYGRQDISEYETSEVARRVWRNKGGDDQTWGENLPLYIHPSVYNSLYWNSSPSWETNTRNVTPVSSFVHDCSKIYWHLY